MPLPRVAYDVTPASSGTTGVARYVHQLYATLRADGADLVPYAFGHGRYPLPEGTRRHPGRYGRTAAAWRLTHRPTVESLTGPIDVVHVTDLFPPPTRARVVMTVHDLVALEHPRLHALLQRLSQREQVRTARHADLVLVTTEVTAAALRARGVRAPIEVAPLAPSPTAPAAARPVDGRFLLAVGELAARKDLPTLVGAFRAADLPADVRLVLAGPDGYGADAVRPLVGDRVLALGRVADDVLAALYRDATALCSASVAEGFNLPMVEAMQAGLPVAASDLPVTREVAGDAVLTVPVGDGRAWSEALVRLVDDGPLRDRLVASGRVRAATFSWERTAAAVAAAYERARA